MSRKWLKKLWPPWTEVDVILLIWIIHAWAMLHLSNANIQWWTLDSKKAFLLCYCKYIFLVSLLFAKLLLHTKAYYCAFYYISKKHIPHFELKKTPPPLRHESDARFITKLFLSNEPDELFHKSHRTIPLWTGLICLQLFFNQQLTDLMIQSKWAKHQDIFRAWICARLMAWKVSYNAEFTVNWLQYMKSY